MRSNAGMANRQGDADFGLAWLGLASFRILTWKHHNETQEGQRMLVLFEPDNKLASRCDGMLYGMPTLLV